MVSQTTLHDVAAAVGVSARTVSRAVNGETGLSDATRERVLAAVDELGYRQNMLAKGLKGSRSSTIALVVTDLNDPFFPALAQSIQSTAEQHDNTLVLAANRDEVDVQSSILRSLRSRGVDGVILFPAAGAEIEDVREQVGPSMPLVVVDDRADEPGAAICNDLAGGARSVVQELVGLGHRHIAMIGNDRLPNGGRRRERGYDEAMSAAGLGDHVLIERSSPNVEGGHEAMTRLLGTSPRPTAVFAYNDMQAIGAMRAAVDRGVIVPSELSVVGFDDVEVAELVTPRLSTVRIHRARLGRMATETLLDLIAADDAADPDREQLLPTTLVRRDSAGPGPHAQDRTGGTTPADPEESHT